MSTSCSVVKRICKCSKADFQHHTSVERLCAFHQVSPSYLFVPPVDPEYIHQRIDRLGQAYNLRILLPMFDIVRHSRLTLTHPAHPLASWKIKILFERLVFSPNDGTTRLHYSPPYKQSEHRPPMLIYQRVFKTRGVFLRTAFTTIPHLNRTDFEMLHASLLRPDPPALHRSPTLVPGHYLPSSVSPQIRLEKVAGPKDAFGRSFRTSTAGEALQPTSPLFPRGLAAAEAAAWADEWALS
ncbi:hypothetical protein EDB85DRAFT_2188352 [Lactarius pseudohatsudake]|nr:hypothetical protein EDB85DRAFT_2188352 [Lactarius pseudohatsudake]